MGRWHWPDRVIDSGVYGIFNVENGRVYIGMSCTLPERWREHQAALNDGRHTNLALQRDWQDFGAHYFVLCLLERSGTTSAEQWNEWRNAEREGRWIREFGTRTYS